MLDAEQPDEDEIEGDEVDDADDEADEQAEVDAVEDGESPEIETSEEFHDAH